MWGNRLKRTKKIGRPGNSQHSYSKRKENRCPAPAGVIGQEGQTLSLRSYAPVLLRSCAPVLLCPCALVLLRSCALVLLCPCVLVLLCSCALVLLCSCAPVLLCSCALVSLCPCVLNTDWPTPHPAKPDSDTAPRARKPWDQILRPSQRYRPASVHRPRS